MNAKTKIDLYQLHKNEYLAPRKPVLITISKATYLSISGQGKPGGETFTDAIGALYGVAFTLKMTRKFSGKRDYAVCKLEALWWGDDGIEDFSRLPQSQWRWKLLIRTPDFIELAELDEAIEKLVAKGKSGAVRDVKLESFVEGQCVQMLHVGPYEREQESISLMKEAAAEKGLKLHGRHHEIYLSDPRRVPAERLRTILRCPVWEKQAH